MIRSSILARWAVALLVVLAGSASVPAVDLYVTGWDGSTQKNVFGKIDSVTGIYSLLNSDIGVGFFYTYGLAWNPNINQFNTLREDGTFSTITTTGIVGSVIANGLTTSSSLASNPATSTMYVLNGTNFKTVNPTTGAETYIGDPQKDYIYGSAFVNGTLYSTTVLDSITLDTRYGSFNLSTGSFTPITASSDPTYFGMYLAYDGNTLFGIKNGSIYTLNPSTGAYTAIATVSGGPPTISSMSAIVAVPEPSTYALVAIATGVMAAIARRRKRLAA